MKRSIIKDLNRSAKISKSAILSKTNLVSDKKQEPTKNFVNKLETSRKTRIITSGNFCRCTS